MMAAHRINQPSLAHIKYYQLGEYHMNSYLFKLLNNLRCKAPFQPNIINSLFKNKVVNIYLNWVMNNQSLQSPQSSFENIILYSQPKYCHSCKINIGSYTYAMVQLTTPIKNNTKQQQIRYCIYCLSRVTNTEHISCYYILNKLEFQIYQPGWTARQQLQLCQGLQKHGFGNWAEISVLIGDKEPGEVEAHYNRYYLKMRSNQNKEREGKRNEINKRSQRKKNRIKNNESEKPIQIQGYMPQRVDFECQYDDEAELWLAEMQFNDEDTPEQIQLKIKTIQRYNQRVKQREIKRDFVIRRNLLDLSHQFELDKQRNIEQKNIRGMMKIFERYLSMEKYEKMIRGLIIEKDLKEKIKIYQDLSDQGVVSLLEAHQAFVSIYHNNHLPRNLRHRKNRYKPNQQQQPTYISTQISQKLFNKTQIQLCKTLKLAAPHLVMIKQTILRELKKHESLPKQKLTSIFSIGPQHIQAILKYMHINGYLFYQDGRIRLNE